MQHLDDDEARSAADMKRDTRWRNFIYEPMFFETYKMGAMDMDQIQKIVKQVHAVIPGHRYDSVFDVAYDHPACLEGEPLLVLDGMQQLEKKSAFDAFGPCDLGAVFVPGGNRHEHWEALKSAGFNVVSDYRIYIRNSRS